MNPILVEAMRLHQAGYCVLPIILDGSKMPALPRWKPYKKSRPTEDQVRHWFFNPRGICVIGGYVSASTEFFDFDDHKDRGGVFEEWIERLPVELIRKLVIYRTPSNGWRAAYRSEACFGGGKPLEARLLVLRFNRTFAGQEDPRLLDKLLTELSGIAAWAIEGLRRLRESGWTAPASSVEEKKNFRRDSSTPLAFLQDCCQVYSPWLSAITPGIDGVAEMCYVSRDQLADAFWRWSVDQGDEDSRGFKCFCRDVRSLIPQFGQVEAKKNVAGKWVRVYEGVCLNQEWVKTIEKKLI